MSGGLVDKVYIGLDNAPAAFDIKSRILGPNGTNLEYIRSETGVVAVLKADKFEPLHLTLHHTRSEALAGARSLALNLIETVRTELAQWSAAQAGGPPPALTVPPPALAAITTAAAPPPVPTPTPTSVTFSTAPTLTSSQASNPILPPPTVATNAPLMTVRQPTVLQLLPQQQQYVLNQENGQLIPIVQPGVQMHNNFTSLPIAQPLGIQQHNFGTQIVDISNMQPMNVTQFRLSGVPSSMSMILPNGFSFPQAQLSTSDSTTVSSATATPVVCAAPSNSAHKILYSTDKDNAVQWTVPGSQTMLIPYQQLQELTNNQHALGNIQPQQFVSIAPAGGLGQSLPLSAAQLHQLQATGGTVMHLNQKPIVSSGSLINIISTGQASSPHIISSSANATKHLSQEARGQKRLADGTPNQLQLRPIAPAGSHVSHEKSGSRDSRTWTSASGRDTAVSMGMKINPAHGTIIHVSSGQQTNVSAGSQEGTGMYIRQNAIQVQTKDGQKQELNKIQGGQNVQMITVPQGMTVLQNPLNISQMPMLGQPNSQVYMIPANHPSLVQGGLQQGIIGQQVLQPGQNVTVMQPNQLGMPGVHYNVPIMNMPNVQQNCQYLPAGINLNTQLSAQQLNALTGQQLTSNISNLPIVQAPPPSSPLTSPPQISVPITQPPPVQQIVPQNFITPTTQQYSNMPPQYMMQTNPGTVPSTPNPYNMSSNQPSNTSTNGSGQSNTTTDNESSNGTNQTNYNITSSQDNGFNQSSSQNFPNEGNVTQNQSFGQNNSTQNQSFSQNPPVTQSNYSANSGSGNYHTTNQPPVPYNPPPNGSNQSTNQSYSSTPPTTQSPSYSPSSTPAPNSYPSSNMGNANMSYPPNSQNPYPNATGQNLAAYANNQYNNYGNSRPWFRPRYGATHGPPGSFPPAGPMAHPPPTSNYNYWQDS